ncbi:glycosyltransferase family 4 protein [Thiotrichales bacterium 19S3-7]|nr:glycosyltransferase family 4 protein [Thiotrichales bacterium 19S3-7]MCF6801488.1 glycosyltransferase family 4 protein [Thiotrichales bacterium 19S3-11]
MHKPVKIAIIDFWSNATDLSAPVAKLILDQAIYLQQKGYIVEVFSKDDVHDTVFHSINYRFFSESKVLNRVFNKWFKLNAFTFNQLIKKLNHFNADIIHIHNRQGLIDTIIKKINNPKTKFVVHYHRNFEHPIIPKQADSLIAVSQSTREWTENKLHQDDRFQVIYNCIFSNVLKLAVTIKPIKVKNKNIKILYAGGYQQHKGYFDLINALSYIKKDFQLFICGPKTGQIKQIDDKRVKVLGNLKFKAFCNIMADSDIVINPSKREAFGLVALEALAFNNILVAAKSGGLEEFLNNRVAFMHQPSNPEDLAAKLNEAIALLSDEAALNNYLANINKFIAPFHPKNMVNQLDCLYQNLLLS